MRQASLISKRLRLFPHAPEHLRALIQGPQFYEQSAGMRAANGLRDFIVSPDVSPEWLAALKDATCPDPWKFGFAVVDLESGLVIGNAGFVGPPDTEGVEIAYGIVAEYQGQGYATEAAEMLVRYAESDSRVQTICAHTLPQKNASTRVLEKCGFRNAGEIIHPTDGRIWRWEKPRSA